MDIWPKQKRSEVMSKIRGKNTKPEMILRSQLFNQGFRYRVHQKNLPGKPDIVLSKFRTVIFVHGCFWHGHACRYGRLPKSKLRYWRPKIEANRLRDVSKHRQLRQRGWRLLVVWQCELRKPEAALKKMVQFLNKWHR